MAGSELDTVAWSFPSGGERGDTVHMTWGGDPSDTGYMRHRGSTEGASTRLRGQGRLPRAGDAHPEMQKRSRGWPGQCQRRAEF